MSDSVASEIKRIGLTGGIGSGKSTVARLLGSMGACIVDADAVSRELTQPGGAAIEPLRIAFGNDIVDATGALDRSRMRALAFSDPNARQRLEGVLHPMIGAETARQAAAAGDATVVFDIPLLAESSHWRTCVDRVLVVDCNAETQIARVMARSGWERAAVQAVIQQQASRVQRRSCADAVIVNDDLSLAELESLVRSIWLTWRHRRKASA